MQKIELDAANWSNILDFYSALLSAIGAPDWHGKSIAALVDTMIWHDEINKVKTPYVVEISNADRLSASVIAEIADIKNALQDARIEFRKSEGHDVDVRIRII